jgi:NADH-quinone oxidoreductase subunit C
MDIRKPDSAASPEDALTKHFQAQKTDLRGEIAWMLDPTQIVDAARILRDEFGFNMLIDITAVDYWPQVTPRFHVVYHLIALSDQRILSLRVPVNGTELSVPTLERVFPDANWFEREVWDLFGIHFEGHSDPRRIMMPEDWSGHPLRKDYPLGYEEVQFSFNIKDIDIRKPYAKE